MSPRAFYELVKDMRNAQRCRNQDGHTDFKTLSEIKRLEDLVDAEIFRVEGILAKREEANRNMDKAVKLLEKEGFEVVEDNRKK